MAPPVFRFLVTCAVLVAARVSAQSAPPSDTAQIRRAIVALEEHVGPANFACDYKFFADVEATEFIFTDARGGITTRAEDLAGEPQCRPRKGTYTLDDIRLQYHGPTVVFSAIATNTTLRDTLPPITLRTRFTDVLVWRDGRWQMVAGHSSRMP